MLLLEQTVLSFLLLLTPTIASTIQTDMIGGRYKPTSERTAEVDAYYALWGINATMLDQVKVDDSHLEVWTLNQEGSGFSVHALVEGKAFGEQEWIWNAPNYKTSLSGVGSSMTSSASLIGPNTIQILNLAMADQITEIQTLRFTASGVEKTYVATKANEGTGETVVWKSFDPRVDQLGKPIPPTSPTSLYLYDPIRNPFVFLMG